ncbi:Metallo-dependent phosphatase [Dentipellis sp. KUC8613]|nr:Metallo-dependent phosphatase [Dentipellis sp. KUC8613]
MFSPRPRRLIFLRAAWVLIVLWGEIGVFFYSTADCRWPTPDTARPGANLTSFTEDRSSIGRKAPTRLLLVSDPQILNEDSYPGRNVLLMALSLFKVDYNMRKSWRVAKTLKPDVVIFLGDMMDNGRAVSSPKAYHTYLERFWSIFAAPPSLPTYYIPGNHDVGIGDAPEGTRLARLRYVTSFGPLNQHVTLANHSLMLIDAPKLVEQEKERATTGVSYAQQLPKEIVEAKFVASITSGGNNPRTPSILFSHIPLWRPDNSFCGPLSERGTILSGRGYEYQNMLSQATSAMLLENFRPSLIFSGDDHDYCDYTHSLPYDDDQPMSPTDVREISVKSFSMAMGVRRPGFHLLTLFNPDASTANPIEKATFADAACLLPDQIRIYLGFYLPLLAISVLIVLHYSATSGPGSSSSGANKGRGGMPKRERPAAIVIEEGNGNGNGNGYIPMGVRNDSDLDLALNTAEGGTADDVELVIPDGLPAPVISPRDWRLPKLSPPPTGVGVAYAHAPRRRASIGCVPRFRWWQWRRWGWGRRRDRDAGLLRRFTGDLWAVAWPAVMICVFLTVVMFW